MTLKNAIPKADIDEVNAFIDNLMETDIPNPDITFLGYTLDPAKGGGGAMPHGDLVRLSPELRQANARLSPWRIHELRNQCSAAKRTFENKRLKEISRLIFGREAKPRSTINFHLGSQQELHQDMAVFHVFPCNYLIGAWRIFHLTVVRCGTRLVHTSADSFRGSPIILRLLEDLPSYRIRGILQIHQCRRRGGGRCKVL